MQPYHKPYPQPIVLGSYFYVIGISFDKMHFTCILVFLSGLKNIKKYVW